LWLLLCYNWCDTGAIIILKTGHIVKKNFSLLLSAIHRMDDYTFNNGATGIVYLPCCVYNIFKALLFFGNYRGGGFGNCSQVYCNYHYRYQKKATKIEKPATGFGRDGFLF